MNGYQERKKLLLSALIANLPIGQKIIKLKNNMQNKRIKIIKITAGVTEKMKEMIGEIMEKSALPTISDVVKVAILNLHQKTFKDYVENRPSGKLSVEEKVDYELKRQEIKKKKQDDKQKEICQRMNGKLETSGNGFTCRFFNYSRHGKHEQSMPIDYLTEELVGLQYQPSKEKLQELIDNKIINLDLK